MSYGNAGRRLRHQRMLYGTEREYATRPYGVVLTSVNPRRDQMTFEGPRSGRTIPISHPYLGPNSWIRVMPERTTRMIINSRADSGEPFVSAYLAETSSQGQLDATYENNQFYYRRLREGEVSIASPGIAEQHFAQGGTVSLRAGPLTTVMDVERLSITSKAPTVITQSLDNSYDSISSETRFGVVKRINTRDSTQDRYIRVTPTSTSDEVFAKEYLRNVKSKASPFTLVDHREGHVVDDSGTEETSSFTGKKLRSRTKWGTSNAEDTILEVDEEGNYGIKIPSGSSVGFNLEVERTDAKVIVGRDELHNVGRNLLFDVTQSASIEARDISLEAVTNISMDADAMMTGMSPIIQFTADATFSATATGAATIGGGSIAIASSSIVMGAGADTPGGAAAANPVLTLRPSFIATMTPLATTVAGLLTPLGTPAFTLGPLAPTIPLFAAIIAYITALQAQLVAAQSLNIRST